MSSRSTDSPPSNVGQLSTWFAEGVLSEIEALEKSSGGSQSYELISGKLVEVRSPTQAVYQFIIADGDRIPEDAGGRIKTDANEYTAAVIGQNANKIDISLQGEAPLPTGIQRAILTVDDTALLRRLADILSEISNKPDAMSPLAAAVFHPSRARVGFADVPATPALRQLTGELPRVIEQALGSSVTYVWGPPGTGKTFAIAHIISALVETNQRVLVSSHTHAAVDQALYELVKSGPNAQGPLADHPLVEEGRILRVGITSDKKIPDAVRLDKVIESKASAMEALISELEARAKPLAERRSSARSALGEWDSLAHLTKELDLAQETAKHGVEAAGRSRATVGSNREGLLRRRVDLEQAQRAWFRRKVKVEQSTKALRTAEELLRQAELLLETALRDTRAAQALATRLESSLTNQEVVCQALPNRESIEDELSRIAQELEPIEEQVRSFQDQLSQLERDLISNATAVFCTLTKSYTGRELDGQKFDAVIVDEISMALPPLIFVVAGRATSRVILVGDFLQLPPIVRSDTEISNARLATDAFHLAGVARDLKAVEGCPVLTKLSVQRRMAPGIADLARHLVYTRASGVLEDHPRVRDRAAPAWLTSLPSSPLVVADTTDLHCWSGKQPGSLSRFNFYSGTTSLQIAALAASKMGQPNDEEPPPIGIVTPYAAQRRLLSKLVKEMGLERWVVPGTVHTFQGGQAKLVIFDSVLDEPYWSARLSNPQRSNEVRRDLNVAVTRAEHKFIFVGSGGWLDKHAKPTSALGEMWRFLKERAHSLKVSELIPPPIKQVRPGDPGVPIGWGIDGQVENRFELLDETSFFERFEKDLGRAEKNIYALAPYFGEYRWPRIQPLFAAALARGVEITVITPPVSEAQNPSYVDKAIENLRNLGAVVVQASGLHGKDIIIDEGVVYTGSMNWSSHRGRVEIIHRIEAPAYARICLEFMQAKYIRQAALYEDRSARVCPHCKCQIQVVNQRRQHGPWDFQAMKVGCTNQECRNYLRNIDERPPFRDVPRCTVDRRLKYKRATRGRGEVWQCPGHQKECPRFKVVPGDPA